MPRYIINCSVCGRIVGKGGFHDVSYDEYNDEYNDGYEIGYPLCRSCLLLERWKNRELNEKRKCRNNDNIYI